MKKLVLSFNRRVQEVWFSILHINYAIGKYPRLSGLKVRLKRRAIF